MELLIAIAIMGILAALSIPAASSLKTAGGMNASISGISLSLDRARTYAMAHNTYVWVGFIPDATSHQLTVGMVAGTTGSPDDLKTNSYAPISKLQIYDQVTINPIAQVSGLAMSGDDIGSSQVAATEGVGFQQSGGHGVLTFSSNILQFKPTGEATIDINPPDNAHDVQIGLQPVKGNVSNLAVFQVNTLTGRVQVFRP